MNKIGGLFCVVFAFLMLTCIVPQTVLAQEVIKPAPIASFSMKHAKGEQNVIFEKSGQFDFIVYDTSGEVVLPVEYGEYDDDDVWHKKENVKKEEIPHLLSKVNYTYKIKKKKVKAGLGTYQVEVKASEEYGGATLKKTIRILPNADRINMSFFYYRDNYRIKGVSDTFHVEASYKKKRIAKVGWRSIYLCER